MKYIIQNKNKEEVNLTDSNFICEGGEGRIYGKSATIYKIYFDQKKTLPKDKIKELEVLDKPNILRPLEIVMNTNLVPIGFTMDWKKDILPMCKMFTNDFRNRFNVDPQTVAQLVDNMVKDIQFIHEKGCLIVDANEMNYMVSPDDFTIPYFIDVDSYQTPHYPATAIMPSIQDYHTKGFNEYSDWFSFAIVATQLFIGIHPYKGSHPKYNKTELEQRMRDNVSIFHKGVTYPVTVRDFSHIPDNYKAWMIELFENGKRILPPTLVAKVNVRVIAKIIKSSNLFEIEFVRNVIANTLGEETFYSIDTLEPVTAYIKDDLLSLSHKGKPMIFGGGWKATDKMVTTNGVFILNDYRVTEIAVTELNSQLVPVIKSNWNVLPNATKLFKGMIYQNVLGMPYIMIPYTSDNGKTAMYQTQVPELKGHDVIEAKHENGIAMIIARHGNVFDRFIFKFTDYKKYRVTVDKDVDFHVPNFVVLDNGVCVSINYNDDVEIFSNRIEKDDVKILRDPDVDFNMKLCKLNGSVHFAKDGMLFKLRMK